LLILLPFTRTDICLFTESEKPRPLGCRHVSHCKSVPQSSNHRCRLYPTSCKLHLQSEAVHKVKYSNLITTTLYFTLCVPPHFYTVIFTVSDMFSGSSICFLVSNWECVLPPSGGREKSPRNLLRCIRFAESGFGFMLQPDSDSVKSPPYLQI